MKFNNNKNKNNQNISNNDYTLTSYGVICFKKIDNENKIVLVRRKNTIGYVEFLRGKYDVNDENYILQLFNYMTNDEKKTILDVNDFDRLRHLLGMTKKSNIYKNEYDRALKKFNILKNNKNESLKLENLIKKSESNWDETEWGIPKGRKQHKEVDLNCAIREFIEETNINIKNIKILFNLKPLIEIYKSINGVSYKHIYYFANYVSDNNKLVIDPKNKNQVTEINDIKWLNQEDSINKIRSYYVEKKEIIKSSFKIIEKLNDFILF